MEDHQESWEKHGCTIMPDGLRDRANRDLINEKEDRLAKKRLNGLVYVMYNKALKARYDKQEKGDSIVLTEIDKSNEWLLGEMGADAWKGA